mmetsp:Transcript_61516/g.181813  ORF Transcript_61516/g.181813 Transcript_61516/m.181813 type:complete len:110 (-) Transcript_61516:567-896(-)
MWPSAEGFDDSLCDIVPLAAQSLGSTAGSTTDCEVISATSSVVSFDSCQSINSKRKFSFKDALLKGKKASVCNIKQCNTVHRPNRAKKNTRSTNLRTHASTPAGTLSQN